MLFRSQSNMFLFVGVDFYLYCTVCHGIFPYYNKPPSNTYTLNSRQSNAVLHKTRKFDFQLSCVILLPSSTNNDTNQKYSVHLLSQKNVAFTISDFTARDASNSCLNKSCGQDCFTGTEVTVTEIYSNVDLTITMKWRTADIFWIKPDNADVTIDITLWNKTNGCKPYAKAVEVTRYRLAEYFQALHADLFF